MLKMSSADDNNCGIPISLFLRYTYDNILRCPDFTYPYLSKLFAWHQWVYPRFSKVSIHRVPSQRKMVIKKMNVFLSTLACLVWTPQNESAKSDTYRTCDRQLSLVKGRKHFVS